MNRVASKFFATINSFSSIKSTFNRVVKAMEARPAVAKESLQAKATYDEGLSCDLECGKWKMKADMPKIVGGEEKGPNPGEFMAMSFCSCNLIAIVMWATQFDIPIDDLEITVEVEKDARGLFGVDNQNPRWKEISYTIDIKSPAEKDKVTQMIDAAIEHSPMTANMKHTFELNRRVNITS